MLGPWKTLMTILLPILSEVEVRHGHRELFRNLSPSLFVRRLVGTADTRLIVVAKLGEQLTGGPVDWRRVRALSLRRARRAGGEVLHVHTGEVAGELAA